MRPFQERMILFRIKLPIYSTTILRFIYVFNHRIFKVLAGNKLTNIILLITFDLTFTGPVPGFTNS